MLQQVVASIDELNEKMGMFIRWLVLVMVFIGAVSAVLRYFSRGLELTLNLTPATEAQWYLFSAIFLLGAAYALRHDAHVRVDVMYERLGPKTRGWIDTLGTIFFLIPLTSMMLWVTFPAVRTSWQIRETSPDPGGLPRYPIKALILISFGLLLLQAFSQLMRHIAVLRSSDSHGGNHDNSEGHS